MPILIDKEPDAARIVAWLAGQCHAPADEVARLYAHERAALAVDASVMKFLHIFAIRRVLEILRPHVTGAAALKTGSALQRRV